MSDTHAHAGHLHIATEGRFDFTNGKMAMWLFIVSDAMAFIGFLGAYMILRMTATSSPVQGGLEWQPVWMLPMDLYMTGVNTFVLICSSVTMVKALAAFQEDNQKRGRLFLALTMLGGSFFVGFQVYEWNHFIHEGITIQGSIVPSLATAEARVHEAGKGTKRFDLALQLFGVRDLKAPEAKGKTEKDWADGKFTEEEYLALPLKLRAEAPGDDRPVGPGAIHHITYGIPGTRDFPQVPQVEIFKEIEKDSDAASRPAAVKKFRDQRARVANGFSSTFFVLTGFHGLHVFIGVCYIGLVLLRSFKGAYTARSNSPIEILGLYWHFVDLVWVLLFMLIYLIV